VIGPAVRVQLLPDVIDMSFVLTFSGGGGLLATFVAAALRLDPDRPARLVVLGNLLGACVGALMFALAAAGVL
jgi:hypothetical protein